MIEQLYDELKALPLEYHEIEMTDEGTILLRNCDGSEACGEEVERIRERAGRHDVVIRCNGNLMEIF